MRIQHNISALNAHRQLGNNNSSVSRNLEKLSSGYRINKAGDDAAGLAISEKMRAQIKGLDTAQKNAQDGISLVQTAEGALTEVHSMLNRMTELATQSANGTYQNETDRDNLQKEITSLKDEINRISDGTNYNGIKLLNGDQGGVRVTETPGVNTPPTAATKATIELNLSDFVTEGIDAGQKIEIGDLLIQGGGGAQVTAGANTTAAIKAAIDGLGAGGITIGGKAYDATFDDTTNKLSLTAQNDEETTLTDAVITGSVKSGLAADAGIAAGKFDYVNGANAQPAGTTAGKTTLDFTKNPSAGDSVKIGGTTYEFVANAADATKTAGATAIVLGANGAATAQALKTELDTNANAAVGAQAVVGNTIELTTATNADGSNNPAAVAVETAGGGLKLQIGEDANSYNQVSVVIDDMDTTNLGIAGVDISTQPGAEAALELIKTAIDKVSSTRGDLGALQNRLDHTINNLGVASENMSAAESRIRDVDMAKEMMDFTKNNILTQASQAMLAQANQLPQGVLQLLQ